MKKNSTDTERNQKMVTNEVNKNRNEQVTDIESILVKAKGIIENINREQLFDSDFRIFKVHQGKTYQAERANGYIWAPADNIHHHEILTEITPGDIIFHYSKGAVVAIGEALSKSINYPCPSTLSGYGWIVNGYRVEVRYFELSAPYSLVAHKTDIIKKRAKHYSSFDSNGKACQGYMYDLEIDLAKLFKSGILSTHQPSNVKRVLNRIK